MDKELCFCVEEKNLYLEHVLVDYMDIPIFFLCSEFETGQYYVVLCTDINEYNYIIVKGTKLEIYNLLHGKTPMRNSILRQKEYWEIISGEEPVLDTVIKHSIDEIDKAFLPEEGACFKILDSNTHRFVQAFDDDFFSSEYYNMADVGMNINESRPCDIYDLLSNTSTDEVCVITELVKHTVNYQFLQSNIRYSEFMENLDTNINSSNTKVDNCETEIPFNNLAA